MKKNVTKILTKTRLAVLCAVLASAKPGEIKHLPAAVAGEDGYCVSVFFPAEHFFSSMTLCGLLSECAEYGHEIEKNAWLAKEKKNATSKSQKQKDKNEKRKNR